ncbi:MAG: hypothetical protein EXR92_06660 [Gemmatimonadetes bacterium]|nr:hypothetical protein [Gemmatimonadota bacterium]
MIHLALVGVLIPTAFIGLFGCAAAPLTPPLSLLDAGQVAFLAERASPLDAPYRLVFDWSLDEPGTRLRGRGVARIEPPFRARLDLFLSNGELAAAAALVGDEMKIAEGGTAELPPPPFLWGTLGIFRPGESSTLVGGRRSEPGLVELTYLPDGGGEILFRLQGSRVQAVEVTRDERPREELRLVRSEGDRFPREATYRHLDEVRELRIRLETVENAEIFSSDIWDPTR